MLYDIKILPESFINMVNLDENISSTHKLYHDYIAMKDTYFRNRPRMRGNIILIFTMYYFMNYS